MFEDTWGVIRSRKSKDRQNNCQKTKGKGTSNALQIITQKTKDQATALNPGVNSGAPEG